MNNNKELYVLGVGDAGLLQAEMLFNKGIKASYLGIGSAAKHERPFRVIQYESRKKEFIPGIRKFLVPDMMVDVEIPRLVEETLQQDYHFLIFAALGGFTGTKFSMAIVKKLIELNKEFTCIVSYPFRFEGKRRAQIAELFVSEFASHPSVKIFRLDNLCRYRDLLLRQAFDFAGISLIKIANDTLKLGLAIEFPQVIRQSREGQIRARRLVEMAKETKTSSGFGV